VALVLQSEPAGCDVTFNCTALQLRLSINASATSNLTLYAEGAACSRAAGVAVPAAPLCAPTANMRQSQNRSLLVGAHWLPQLQPDWLSILSKGSFGNTTAPPGDSAQFSDPLTDPALLTFHGSVDEVHLWERALSPEEVAHWAFSHEPVEPLLSSDPAMRPPRLAGLAVYLPFSEGGGIDTGVLAPAMLIPSLVEYAYSWPRFVLSGPLCYPVSRCGAGAEPVYNTSLAGLALTACCQLCPAGRYALDAASTCVRCPVGRYQPDANASTCLPCAVGMTTFGVGATHCAPVHSRTPVFPPYPLQLTSAVVNTRRGSNATSGATASNATVTDDAAVLLDEWSRAAELPSFISIDGTCAPGTYLSPLQIRSPQQGWDASSSRMQHFKVCEPCAPGTASNTTNAAQCAPCLPGSYSAAFGSTSCTLASPGTACGQPGLSACPPCSPGSVASTSGRSLCGLCAVGTYQGSSNATACKPCTAGRFAPALGATTCFPCRNGTFSSAVGQSVCFNCSVGYVTAEAAVRCSACPPGSYSNRPELGVCQNCAPGRFNNASVSSSCTFCSRGTYSTAAGQTICLQCPPGRHGEGEGSAQCSACGVGRFSNISAATSCRECASGSYSSEPAATSCLTCPASPPTWTLPLEEQERMQNTSRCAHDNFALFLNRSLGHTVYVPQTTASHISDSFTVMAWVRPQCSSSPANCTSSGPQASMTVVSQIGSWSLALLNGCLVLALPGVGSSPTFSTSIIDPCVTRVPFDVWTHVATTVQAAPAGCWLGAPPGASLNCSAVQVSLYVNASTSPFTAVLNSSAHNFPASNSQRNVERVQLVQPFQRSLLLGAHWQESSLLPIESSWRSLPSNKSMAAFHGAVDEFRVWHRSLSAAELQRAWSDRVIQPHAPLATEGHDTAGLLSAEAVSAQQALSTAEGLYAGLTALLGFDEGSGTLTGVYPVSTLLPQRTNASHTWPLFARHGPLCTSPSRCARGSEPNIDWRSLPSVQLSSCCRACPPGFYSIDASAMCRACPIGTISSIDGTSSCAACPDGYTTVHVGSTRCVLAQRTSVQVSPAAMQLQPSRSPNGTFANGWLDNADPLQLPSSNMFCGAGTSIGPVLIVDAALPNELKQPPFLPATEWQRTCMLCPAGSFNNGTNAAACVPCSAGWAEPTLGATACRPCPVSSYQPASGQARCRACTTNSFSRDGGRVRPCELCDSGYSLRRNLTANQTEPLCLACPAQTVSMASNATGCLAVPAGYFTAEWEAASVFYECPAGSRSLPFDEFYRLSYEYACAPNNFAMLLRATAEQYVVVPRPIGADFYLMPGRTFTEAQALRQMPSAIRDQWSFALWLLPHNLSAVAAPSLRPSGPLLSEYRSWGAFLSDSHLFLSLPGMRQSSEAGDGVYRLASLPLTYEAWYHIAVTATAQPTGCRLTVRNDCHTLLLYTYFNGTLAEQLMLRSAAHAELYPLLSNGTTVNVTTCGSSKT